MSYRLVAAFDDHENSISQLLIVVEEMHRLGIVIHSYSFLDYGAKIALFSKRTTILKAQKYFFTPYYNMSRRFCTFAAEKRLSADSFYHFKTMVTELLVIWVVGVVSFFVLWVLLAKVIKRISEKKEKQKAEPEDPNL